MREYKFRAWDALLNHMSNPFKLGDTFINWADDDIGMLLNFFLSKKRGTIMSFTGLQDINGKDLAEGDIVRRRVFIRDKHQYNTGQIIRYAEWQSFIYHQIGDACGDSYIGDMPVDQCISAINPTVTSLEIIGNIYENPELSSV